MISVVVPTYNESGNIEALIERASASLSASGEPYELIIVDDNSPDGTAEKVRSLQTDRPWLRLTVRTEERGLSTAVMAGWRVAKGDVLGCMDADLQHPPEVLAKLVSTLRTSGADIVVASRHVAGGGVSEWSFTRRFVSWTASLLATLAVPGVLGAVRDPMSGFFLLRRDVIQTAALRPRGYKILLEVLAKGDYSQVKEVPFVFEERVEGGSKIGSAVMWDYLVHLVRISIETGEARRAAKFISVGLSGAVVNLFFYRLLMAAPWFRVWQAATIAAALAMVNNFIWNEWFTFSETHRASSGVTAMARRFLMFTLICVVGLILNVGVVQLLVAILHFPWVLGVAAGIAVAGAWNFFTNANLTWNGGRKRETESANRTAAVSMPGREAHVGKFQ
jgi:dolichol-phosphate mannosyltransferase